MNDPLKALLDAGVLQTSPFPPNSRYHGLQVAELAGPDGEPLVYVTRRFVPPPERLAVVQEHTTRQGDRLDNLAAQYLGDPELYWRLCDANGALRPDELVDEAGRRLVIALPDGVPGANDV